jgi:hypothetical protein
MLSRSLPRLSNLKALFPLRPRNGWHQPGEITALGPAHDLDANRDPADAEVLQSLMLVGSQSALEFLG